MPDYPDAIAELREVENMLGRIYEPTLKSRIFAEDVNAIIAEIEAIETELGILPKGTKSSVKQRIIDIESLVPTAPFLKSTGSIYKNAEVNLINSIHNLIGSTNIVSLLIFDPVTGTTVTDRGLLGHNATLTDDASTITPANQGMAPHLTINGNSHPFTLGDSADFTFNNGASDTPFSIISLLRPTTAYSRGIINKYDSTTGATKREYDFQIDANGYLYFRCTKESNASYIGRAARSAIVDNSVFQCLGVTYSGSQTNAGIKLFKNGIQIDDTNFSSGSYTGMENTACELRSCIKYTAGQNALGFTGYMSIILIAKIELTTTQTKLLNTLLLGYANLGL